MTIAEDATAASGLRVTVASETPLTVRDNGVHTAFLQQVRALRLLGADVRVNDVGAARGSDMTIAHGLGPLSLACLRNARCLSVAVAHVTPDTLRGSLRGERRWRAAMRLYLRRFYLAADLVAAPATPVITELLELGIPRSRIFVLPLGVDGELMRRVARRSRSVGKPLGSNDGVPLVLGVGQVQPRKGIATFVDAARALPHARFVWVGGQPFGALTASDAPTRRAVRCPAANVTFTGRVPYSHLCRIYSAADIFFLPSCQENFGQVVIEAGAFDLPLVLPALPAFTDHFADAARLVLRDRLIPTLADSLEDRSFRRSAARSASELARRYTAVASAEALLRATRVREHVPVPEPLAA